MDTFTTPAPPPSTFASTIVLTSLPRSWPVISCSGRPSLLAYNDVVFTKDDFVSISRIGDSKKQGQVWKTGRFKVGFNSVYHLPFPMAAAAPAAHCSSKTESYVDAKHCADICQANILTARFIANVVRISLSPDAARHKVCYFYDTEVGNYYDGYGHPMNPHRIRMTLALFLHYGLLDQMQVLKPHSIRDRDLCCFHAHEYINFLRSVTPETQQDQLWALKRFNVGEYCPVFDGLYTFCQTYAGGLVGSAVKLNHNHANIAINWAGGLHHTKKCGASGFCYVNDVVLTVLELLKIHVRVLYVNIDIHHGDGVDEVF